MKKNRALSVCILILQLALISGSFLAGYLLVQNSYEIPSEIAAYVAEVRAEREQITGTARPEEEKKLVLPSQSRCDLYLMLGEDGNLQTVMAGYLDALQGSAVLITIPLDSYLDLPEDLYRELTAEFPTIPQVFELGVLSAYVGEARIGEVTARIFEELRVCSFAEAWTVRAAELAGWFTQRDGVMHLSAQTKEWMQLSIAGKQVLKKLEAFERASSVRSENASENSLRAYAEVIMAMQPGDIVTETAAGVQQNEHYSLNLNRMAQQLSGLYVVVQENE